MHRISAGILFYRLQQNKLQVLLVHPGGPYWVKKEAGADEQLLEAAIRETEEETGIKAQGKFIALTPVKQKSGKIIYAWGLQDSFDASVIKSNTFEIEWPPKSGKKKSFPEIDTAAWFGIEEAKNKINAGQISLVTELESLVNRKQ